MDTLSLRRRALAALAPLALATGLALLAGCTNPFTPASPEAPNPNAVATDYSSPDSLIMTMARGIEARSSGRSAYMDALADSTSPSTPAFYAFHDPAVTDAWALNATHQPPDWTKNSEQTFWNSLTGLAPTTYKYSFAWAQDTLSLLDQIDLSAGTALIHRHYKLEATSSTQTIVYAVGYADLSLLRQSGKWVLYRWQDRLDPAIGVNPAEAQSRSMGYRRLDSLSGSGT